MFQTKEMGLVILDFLSLGFIWPPVCLGFRASDFGFSVPWFVSDFEFEFRI